MVKNKLIVLFAISVLLTFPFLSNIYVRAEDIKNSPKINLNEIPENYLIEGVPYVSQETNFFCGYATPTMILKYFGINTTLDEVVYNSGVGYSLMYPSFKNNRLPFCGWITSQECVIYEFLSDLYGVTFSFWKAPKNSNFNDIWEEYCLLIKQNISEGLPVAAVVEESTLVIDNLGLKFLSEITKNLPKGFGHFILLLGYNETNQTVCYNDPAYGIINKPELGTYRWVNLTKFKTSSSKVSYQLYVKIFSKNSEEPSSKQEAFNLSHKRNIEKLKGNFSVYFDEYSVIYENDNYSLGINALERLKGDLKDSIINQIKTAYIYKLNNNFGFFYRFMDRIYKHTYKIFPYNINKIILDSNDVFENIAIEKNYTANYLKEIQNNLTDENLINLCKYESSLFKYESENWSKIENYYNEFRKKGVFMPLPQALTLLNNIAEAIENIILIEEAIIRGPIEP